jgi:hypothetical protein
MSPPLQQESQRAVQEALDVYRFFRRSFRETIAFVTIGGSSAFTTASGPRFTSATSRRMISPGLDWKSVECASESSSAGRPLL